MVGLAKGLQDHLHDEVSTHATLVSRLLEPGVQEVLLAVHLLAHMVERLPAESSPCNNKGRARVPGSLDTRDGDSASISQHPLPRDVKWIKDEFLNFPLMLLILY